VSSAVWTNAQSENTTGGITLTCVIFCPECKTYIGSLDICPACNWHRPPEAILPEPGQPYWRFQTQGGVLGAAALGPDALHLGSMDGHLYSLERWTREVLWHVDLGSPVEGGSTLAEGLVCVGAHNGNLYAFDATSGREVWRYRTGDKMRAAPRIHGSTVYVGSADAHLHAVSLLKGRQVWRFETKGVIRSTPVVERGVVFVGSYDGHMYAISADSGTELWTFETKGPVTSSATVCEDKLYFGSQDGYIYALDVHRGRQLWRFGTRDYVHSSPCVADGVVYVGSNDSNVYALDADSGKPRWQHNAGSAVASSPALWEGVLFVGDNARRVHALDAENGEPIWTFACGDSVTAPLLVGDGVVYVGSHDGCLYALPWHLGRWEKAAQWCEKKHQNMDAACYHALGGNTPVAALLLKGQREYELAARLLEEGRQYTEAARSYRAAAAEHERRARTAAERAAAGALFTRAAYLFTKLKDWNGAMFCRYRAAANCELPLLEVECQPKSQLREGAKGLLELLITNVGRSSAHDIEITVQGEALRQAVQESLWELPPSTDPRSVPISVFPEEGGNPSLEISVLYQDREHRSFRGRCVVWPWVEPKVERPSNIRVDKQFLPGTKVSITTVEGDAVIIGRGGRSTSANEATFEETKVGGDAILIDHSSGVAMRTPDSSQSQTTSPPSDEPQICARCGQSNSPHQETCSNCGGQVK